MPDPLHELLQSLLIGIISDAFLTLVPQLGRQDSQILSKLALIQQSLDEDKDIASILSKGASSAARAIPAKNVERIDKLKFALVSPEVASILRQVFSLQLTTKHASFEDLNNRFHEVLKQFGVSVTKEVSEKIFGALVSACQRSIQTAVKSGALSALEASFAAQQRIIRDELVTIRKRLDTDVYRNVDVQEIMAFESRFRDSVKNYHGFVSPPHLDQAKRVPIENLYVSPTIVKVTKRQDQLEPLELEKFLPYLYRNVLLGTPGAGKSTLAGKLCHNLALHYLDQPMVGRRATPILVVLRDYGTEKKQSKCSIVDFIESTANSTYQVKPPKGAIDYILANSRAVVIFDGLDELVETSHRREVSNDIETFCSLYPSVPVMVTSREVGYEQSPLNDKTFKTFRLAGFNEKQIAQYASNWFGLDETLTPNEKEKSIASFLNESKVADDLRSNPLMLGLMCNIYRGETFIPRNRPAVYEKCALMLFDRWDRSRRIDVPFTYEDQLGPVMKFLAHWIYCSEELQSGVTEKQLVEKTSEYLCEWSTEDKEAGRTMARDFIKFCSNRAWVFTDVGLNENDENLFKFTHRTFLEYFAAGHLVRIYPTPETLGPVLQPRVSNQEWDVVAQLAVQLQNKQVQGAGGELLKNLLNATATGEKWKRVSTYSFACRCLDFLIPKPEIVRQVAEVCTALCLERLYSTSPRVITTSGMYRARYLITELLNVAKENKPLVVETIQKIVAEGIASGDERGRVHAFNFGMNLAWFVGLNKGKWHDDVYSSWFEVSSSIFEIHMKQMLPLAKKHYSVCHEFMMRDEMSVQETIDSFGAARLFKYHSLEYRGTYPFVWSLLAAVTDALSTDDIATNKRALGQLEQIGDSVLRMPLPLISSLRELTESDTRWFFERGHLQSESKSVEYGTLKESQWFGLFCIIATVIESADYHPNVPELVEWLKSGRAAKFVKPFSQVIKSRLLNSTFSGDLSVIGFNTSNSKFCDEWAQRKFNLIGRGRKIFRAHE